MNRLSPSQKSVILELAKKKAGLRLSENLHGAMEDYLLDQMTDRDLDFDHLALKLETDDGEFQRFAQAVTIGETYLFREEKQFRLLEETLLPSLVGSNPPMYLWSAACASGEEAVSLALVAERAGQATGVDFHILASDLNEASLAKARSGTIPARSFREDGSTYHSLVRARLSPLPSGQWQLPQDLAEKITWFPCNLKYPVSPDLPEEVQVIFLRNVLIYLDSSEKQAVLNALVQRLSSPGYLFLSASEVTDPIPPGTELREESGVFYLEKLRGKAPSSLNRSTSAVSISAPRHPVRAVRGQRSRRSELVVTTPALAAPDPWILECFAMINGDRAEDALVELQAASSGAASARDAPFIQYLQGLAALRLGRTGDALDAFGACLRIDDRFWIARFQKAILEVPTSPDEARRAFLLVQRTIERELDASPPSFLPFLEGFDARYFLGLAQNWISRLSIREEHRGLR